MRFYEISGGRPLNGQLTVQGAKNSALPILTATLLARGESVIHNCPQLSDVSAALRILRLLGCRVSQQGDTVTVDATAVMRTQIPSHLMEEMRASVLFMGALLGRMGCATLCAPGGCQLGDRPIDLHLTALRQLGAVVTEGDGCIHCEGRSLRGRTLYLPFPSVGATENLMLAACCAVGTTVLIGAACEPEIWDLQQCLRGMGASIRGAGSAIITIEGGKPLHPVTHRVIGDRIVAATYLCACAGTGGAVRLDGIDPNHLTAVLDALGESGCEIATEGDAITLHSGGRLRGISPVRTAPYPRFPTDAQAILMAALAGGEGSTLFAENMFTNRYRHIDQLRHMGADIQRDGRVAVVTGVRRLCGSTLRGSDLRCGAALAVAALSAEGRSKVYGVSYIRRGYASLDGDLRQLGGEMTLADERT